MTKIAVAVLAAGALWMFSFASSYAQGMTEYLGTTGQSAGQMAPGQSLGSAISHQLQGAGQAIDSGSNPTPSYDSNREDQDQPADSGGNSKPYGPTGGSEDNYDN